MPIRVRNDKKRIEVERLPSAIRRDLHRPLVRDTSPGNSIGRMPDTELDRRIARPPVSGSSPQFVAVGRIRLARVEISPVIDVGPLIVSGTAAGISGGAPPTSVHLGLQLLELLVAALSDMRYRRLVRPALRGLVEGQFHQVVTEYCALHMILILTTILIDD